MEVFGQVLNKSAAMNMPLIELDISDVGCLCFIAKEQVIFSGGSAFTV
jgi:hypothetical protein